jgi:hypothetical protein
MVHVLDIIGDLVDICLPFGIAMEGVVVGVQNADDQAGCSRRQEF